MSDVKVPECWVCLDKGLVLYQDKDGYEFITHCICKAGNRWQYDGRKCLKNPSKYYIPSVMEKFDVHDLARENLINWCQIYIHKTGVKDVLRAKGIQIDNLPLEVKKVS